MKKILALLVVLITGVFIGVFISHFITPSPAQNSYKINPIRGGSGELIDPLVDYEIDAGFYTIELGGLKAKIQNLINQKINEGKVKDVAVYFRELHDGPWFGINEDEDFFPASLLKVPLMFAYFKMIQDNPEILKKQITYDKNIGGELGNFNNGEYIKPEKQIEVGKSYSIDELITYMIVYSDNNAKNLLILNLDDPNKLFQVYLDLGLSSPPELRGNGSQDVLSVHEYVTFYRALYNVSYLNKEMSLKALGLLIQAKFPQGITSGIPQSIKVGNKFGEYSKKDFKQLHDCGIIYYPKNPYILCLMTRGYKFEDLEGVIKDISSLIYNNIDQLVKQNSK